MDLYKAKKLAIDIDQLTKVSNMISCLENRHHLLIGTVTPQGVSDYNSIDMSKDNELAQDICTVLKTYKTKIENRIKVL